MSRFDSLTKRISLGECRCPGTPHADGDWIELRSHTPWGAIFNAEAADSLAEQFYIVALATIVGWNLLDGDGKEPVPITQQAIDDLDPETFRQVSTAVHVAVDQGNSLPNARGASSRRSSRVSAESPTQPIPTP